MTSSELRVRRVSHRGHVVEFVLNPLWVQLDQKTHAEYGIEKLYLVSKGRRVSRRELPGSGRKSKLCQRLNVPRCRPPGAARPIIRSLRCCRKSGGFGSASAYIRSHDEPCHE